jgi:hypothetical protein
MDDCGTTTGTPRRKSGECALAPGNSAAFPYVTPLGTVVVELDVVDVVVVSVVVEVVDVVVLVVLLVLVVGVGSLAGQPMQTLPGPCETPPWATHAVSSCATNGAVMQQTTAPGLPHVERAAQRIIVRPASSRQPDLRSEFR